jgi:hypothetical protein
LLVMFEAIQILLLPKTLMLILLLPKTLMQILLLPKTLMQILLLPKTLMLGGLVQRRASVLIEHLIEQILLTDARRVGPAGHRGGQTRRSWSSRPGYTDSISNGICIASGWSSRPGYTDSISNGICIASGWSSRPGYTDSCDQEPAGRTNLRPCTPPVLCGISLRLLMEKGTPPETTKGKRDTSSGGRTNLRPCTPHVPPSTPPVLVSVSDSLTLCLSHAPAGRTNPRPWCGPVLPWKDAAVRG